MAKGELMDFDKALELFEPVHRLRGARRAEHQDEDVLGRAEPANSAFHGAEPNTLVTPVDLGLPGSLPVVNEQAVRYSISLGLALGCSDRRRRAASRARTTSTPTSAKNYQISQYDEPIAFEGSVEVELADGTRLHGADRARAHGGGRRQAHARRRLDRPHPGRRVLARRLQPRRRAARRDRHEADLRRRAPTRPRSRRRTCRRSATSCSSLGISEARMERGNLRCDANVSLRPRGHRRSSAPAPRRRT